MLTPRLHWLLWCMFHDYFLYQFLKRQGITVHCIFLDYWITILSYADSDEELDEFISHQDSSISPRYVWWVIVSVDEVNVDELWCGTTLVSDLTFSCPHREVKHSYLWEVRSTCKHYVHILQLSCVLADHIRQFSQLLRIFHELVTVPEENVMLYAV